MLSTRCCILFLSFLFILLTLLDPKSSNPRGVEATTTVDESDILKNGKLSIPPSTYLHQESCHLHGNVARKITCYERKTMEKDNIVVEDDYLKGTFTHVDSADYLPPKEHPPRHPVQIETKD